MLKSLYQKFNENVQKIDWMLLLFLVLFTNVKMIVKIASLLFFLFYFRKNIFKSGFFRQRFGWFYIAMIIIILLNLLINISGISINYLVVTIIGVFFWLMCIGAAALTYQFVKKNDTGKLHSSISVFFLLNATVTIVQLILIMWDAGSLNPYTYQGMNQKYFISTGDLIKGLTLDVSTTNALINAMGILYFLDRRKIHWVLLCMITLLLTASNFTNVLLMVIFCFLFIFNSDRNQKTTIVMCFLLFVVFLVKVSPQNKHYLNYVWQKLSRSKIDTILPETTAPRLTTLSDSVLNEEEKRQKFAMNYLDSIYLSQLERLTSEKKIETDHGLPVNIVEPQAKPQIPKANIHTEPYQRKKDTSEFRREMIEFSINKIPGFNTDLSKTQQKKLPGKLIGLKQTFRYLKAHPQKLMTGSGTGQFSSKLSYRATGLKFAGGYPENFIYINNDFRDNHLKLYLDYFTKDAEVHSLMNTPDSVYDQLLAEYGIAGLVCFLILYVGYFLKSHRKKSYGVPLMILFAGALGIGYWFEQLSIIILFEVLMFINIKETGKESSK